MQFNKVNEDTIEVSENGVIGYIVIEEIEAVENIPFHKNVFFEFKSGVNPSLTLEEMKEIVKKMERING